MLHSIEVDIDHAEAYRIWVGNNIWKEALDYFSTTYADRKVFIVIDEKVFHLHGERIKQECHRYFNDVHTIQIPEGEESKSVGEWKRLQNELLENGVERSTPLLAVGGGVTGDLAGFVAATVLRGIPLVHLPTSLLAMVDSSIGGKSGVNHPAGKNLIGSFYQPDAVFSDIQFLKTLERREWIGGLAEMLKYAAIRTPTMFDELEQAVAEGFEPSERWMNLIQLSAAIKVEIVRQDVREAGKRAWLNFGHTFGHALEKQSGYGNILHGEAVFAGMLAATYYSRTMGAAVDEARFNPFRPLYRLNLPGKKQIPELIDAMRYDKKVKRETIRLVLLEQWGKPVLREVKEQARLAEAWQATLEIVNGN